MGSAAAGLAPDARPISSAASRRTDCSESVSVKETACTQSVERRQAASVEISCCSSVSRTMGSGSVTAHESRAKTRPSSLYS
jgi:hypothetical protein